MDVAVSIGCNIDSGTDSETASYGTEFRGQPFSGNIDRNINGIACSYHLSEHFTLNRVYSVPRHALLSLNRLKQRFEVTLPKAPRPVSLDDFEEQRGPVLHWLREDLKHVALVVAVHEDS